jgi:predicted amino acid racemase
MFLNRLVQTNADFVLAAVRLHQSGEVRANRYLIDLETLERNAVAIKAAADAEGLAVYFMAKQFGRNPDACRAIAAGGLSQAVVVDLQGMEALARSETRIGHIGHLVQPHRGAEDAVVRAEPEVVTVFSFEFAERLGVAAVRAGRTQDVLLRVTAPGDFFYFGHGGGFRLDEIESAAARVDAISGLTVVGVTTFPCLLADPESKRVEPTPNLATLIHAAEKLRAAGFDVRQINAPGTTSAGTMATLAQHGATHAEPGNALHGTTPMHVFDADAPELPAILYLSEISHVEADRAYAFGAGLYVDKVLGPYQETALCGRDESITRRPYRVEMAPDGAIHYYCTLQIAQNHDVRVGDAVIFCYRPQTFVTRARTQGIGGIGSGQTELGGVYDQEARPVSGVS